MEVIVWAGMFWLQSEGLKVSEQQVFVLEPRSQLTACLLVFCLVRSVSVCVVHKLVLHIF